MLCILGMIGSAAAVIDRRCRSSIDLGVLWWLYTSMSPDDPPMLADAGFVAVLAAPYSRASHKPSLALTAAARRCGLATSRWFIFTVMLEAGAGTLCLILTLALCHPRSVCVTLALYHPRYVSPLLFLGHYHSVVPSLCLALALSVSPSLCVIRCCTAGAWLICVG